MKTLLESRRARVWTVVGGAALVIALLLVALIARVTSSTPNVAGTVRAPGLSAPAGSAIYTLDQSGSTASFTIDEVLFGNPNTVVGTTNQVAGQIAIDKADPSKSVLGEIKVDLTGLKTDSDRRNGAIQNFILETSDPANQYATFTPTKITGLPASISSGQQVNLIIEGNLTIHQRTHPATFTGTATLSSANTLTGQLHTTIDYTTYGISIPDVPFVTGVGKTVTLALKFTAHSTS